MRHARVNSEPQYVSVSSTEQSVVVCACPGHVYAVSPSASVRSAVHTHAERGGATPSHRATPGPQWYEHWTEGIVLVAGGLAGPAPHVALLYGTQLLLASSGHSHWHASAAPGAVALLLGQRSWNSKAVQRRT